MQTAVRAAEVSKGNASAQLEAAGKKIEALQLDKHSLACKVAGLQQEAGKQHQLLNEVHDHLQHQHASYEQLKAKHAEVEQQAQTAFAHIKDLESQQAPCQQLHSRPLHLEDQLGHLSAKYEAALQQFQESRTELAARNQQQQQACQHERECRQQHQKLEEELQMLLAERQGLQLSVHEAEATIQQAQAWQEQLLQEVGKLHAALQELACDKSAWSAAVTKLEARAAAAETKCAQVPGSRDFVHNLIICAALVKHLLAFAFVNMSQAVLHITVLMIISAICCSAHRI